MNLCSKLSFFLIFLLPFISIQTASSKGAQSSMDPMIKKLCGKRTNLARKNWTVRTGIPVLDQGPQRMCYAHAASTYLDVWRAWNVRSPTKVWQIKTSKTEGGISTLGGLKLKKRIGLTSPYWIGFLAKTSQQAQTGKRSGNLNDGSGELGLDVIARGLDSVCREDVMRKSMKEYSGNLGLITVPEFYNFTAWFFDRFNPSIRAKLTRTGISVSRSCRKRAGVMNQKTLRQNESRTKSCIRCIL